MNGSLTIERDVHFRHCGRGARKVIASKTQSPPPATAGRLPRVAKLMALAIRFDGLIRDGIVPDYAALARLGRVSRARITQIMNLLLLAPDLQEALLFLPPIERGKDPWPLRLFQPIALTPDWNEQRRRCREIPALPRVAETDLAPIPS